MKELIKEILDYTYNKSNAALKGLSEIDVENLTAIEVAEFEIAERDAKGNLRIVEELREADNILEHFEDVDNLLVLTLDMRFDLLMADRVISSYAKDKRIEGIEEKREELTDFANKLIEILEKEDD